jgi:hypothetical protein
MDRRRQQGHVTEGGTVWSCSQRCRWPPGRTPSRPCTGSARSSASSAWPPARAATTGATSPSTLTGRGLTTRPMGHLDGTPIFCIDVDLVDHQLRILTLDGQTAAVPLPGQSVASFHHQTLAALAGLGIGVAIAHPCPFDLPDGDRPTDRSPTTASTPATTRSGPAATGRCSARSTCCWRRSRPGSRARSARCTTSGTPSTCPHPLRRPPPRPATDGGCGAPGGVLAGGDQRRVLVWR